MFMVTYMFQKEYSKTAAASDPFIFKYKWYETRDGPPRGDPGEEVCVASCGIRGLLLNPVWRPVLSCCLL